jgi:hypothetical protein
LLCSRKRTAFYGQQSLNCTPMFDISLIRHTWTKNHKFSDLWWFGKTCERDRKCLVTKYSNSFPVRWCIISLLSHCSCLSKQGVSWLLNTRRDPIPWPTHSLYLPRVIFFWQFAKDTVYQEKEQNVNKLCERTVAKCVTNKKHANTWQETEYHFEVSCATTGAHTEMHWAHKKLSEI